MIKLNSITEKIILTDNITFAKNLKKSLLMHNNALCGVKTFDMRSFVTQYLCPMLIDNMRILPNEESMRIMFDSLVEIAGEDENHCLNICIKHPSYRFSLMDFIEKIRLSGIEYDLIENAYKNRKWKSLFALLCRYDEVHEKTGSLDYPGRVQALITALESKKYNNFSFELVVIDSAVSTFVEKKLIEALRLSGIKINNIRDYTELPGINFEKPVTETSAFPNSYAETSHVLSKLLSSKEHLENTIIASVDYNETVQNIRDLIDEWGTDDKLKVNYAGGLPVKSSLSYRLLNRALAFFDTKNYPAYFISLLKNNQFSVPTIEYKKETKHIPAGVLIRIISEFPGHFRFNEFDVRLPVAREERRHDIEKHACDSFALILKKFADFHSIMVSETTGIENKIEALHDFFKEICRTQTGEHEGKAGKIILESIKSFRNEELYFINKRGMHYILGQLIKYISGKMIPVGNSPGAVSVMPLRDLPGLSVPNLYITGLSSGVFPGRVHQNPLFLDIEINRVNELAGDMIIMNSVDETEKRYKDSAVFLNSAEKNLFMSYVFYDGKRVISPSDVIYDSNPELSAGAESLEGFIESIGGTTDLKFLEGSSHELFPVNPPGSRKALESTGLFASLYDTYGTVKTVLEKRFFSNRLTVYDGRVKKKGSLKWSEDFNMTLSATSTMDLIQCPFRYFLKKILKVEHPSIPEDISDNAWLDNLSWGSLVHEALEVFFNRTRGKKTSNKEAVKILEKISKKVLDEHREFTLPPDNIFNHESDLFIKHLASVIDNEGNIDMSGGFNNLMSEAAFGLKEKYPGSGNMLSEDPVTLKIDSDTSIKYVGYIDRIDINNKTGTARLMDYKTGKNKLDSDASDWIKDARNLQHVIYGMVFEKFMKEHGVKKIETGYYFIPRGEDPELESADFFDLKDRFLSMMSSVMGGIRNENCFYMNSSSCGYCDYKDICAGNDTIMDKKYSKIINNCIAAVKGESED